ncbi:LysR family transcriptional regulator [Micromonospora sp. 15K316]|uniref:LysR family transcriptional regulator n=1 Tax=Micromonospora sp. 15K316 TaxID=2530376 RepID=UPI001049478E|nr:LysR family transcriptional regulator [Micromonospora sp. 15K316]TDC40408.1 LysR family transcriptional regulator [Micromonospora sp. 15K316]
MELRHLATFTAVAEEGSFTRAADRLRVVQSAVSATMRNLERELGVTLFERTTHRVELTDAGRMLLPQARRTLAAADGVREVVDQLRGGLRGTVRLGMLQSGCAAPVNVARLLADFGKEHPGVDVELRVGSSRQHSADLRGGRLDLAFVALPRPDAKGLQLTPIDTQVMRFCCAPDHPLAERADVELSALTGEVFADGPETWGSRIATDRAFAAAGIERVVRYEVADVGGLLDLVRHRLAVLIAPPLVVEPGGNVRLIPIRQPAPVFGVSLAAPADRQLGAPARALLATVQRRIPPRPAPPAAVA